MNRWIVLAIALLCVTQAWSAPSNFEADEPDDAQGDDPSEDGTQDDAEGDTGPPEMISTPDTFKHLKGETAYLPCEAKNIDDVALLWYKDNVLLNFNLEKNMKILENNTLMIENLEERDTSANYTCSIAQEGATKQQSVSYRLIVTDEDNEKIEITPSKHLDINEGSSIVLGCRAKHHSPKQISWSFRGHRQKDNTEADESTVYLRLTNVSWTMAGDYQCMVDDAPFAKPTIAVAHLRVRHRPVITVEKDEHHHHLHTGRRDYFTGVGEDITSTITCIVHSHPPLKHLEWYRNGERVYVDGRRLVKHNLTDHNHVLTIHGTSKEDLGEYRCKASNDMGETTGPIIGLKDTPNRPVWLRGEVVDSNSIRFDWKVLSYKEITDIQLNYRKKGDNEWQQARESKVISNVGKERIIQTIITGIEPDKTYEAILKTRNDDIKDGGYVHWGPESALKFFNTTLEKAESVRDSGMRSEINFMTLLVVFAPLMYLTCL